MPLPHIVIDTNVMVAGLRSRRGSVFRLFMLVGTGRFAIHLSVPLVLECEEVLLRELPHLQVPRSVVEDVLDFHCTVATHEHRSLVRPHLLGERQQEQYERCGAEDRGDRAPRGGDRVSRRDYRAPQRWTQRAYRNLVYCNEVDKGGHFAAWEQPQLFADELRAAFRSLRGSP